MLKAYSHWLSVAMLTGAVMAGSWPELAAADPVIAGCLVKLEDDVKLGAREPGVLLQLNVKEGSDVRQGEVIGKVDDSEALIQKAAAEWALAAAVKQAKDDVEVRYAQASSDVAQKAYEMMVETNRTSAKAVPEIEVIQKRLEWDRAKLSAEKAALDQKLAEYDARAKRAELDAAQLGLDRRVIRAEFDGEVVKLFRQQGEWVGPGDPILQLVRLDTMLVDGAIEQSAYDAHEIQNCEVTVEVEMARGRKEQFKGRVTFVSPMVRIDGKYVVRAEVQNREEYGQWLLRDGMTANMMIHLNTGGAAPIGVSRAP